MLLNYSAHAIEDLEPKLEIYRQHGKETGLLVNTFLKLLNTSVKFILPEDGIFIDRDKFSERIINETHLPYPVIACEFKSSNRAFNESQNTLRSSKRIALAIDSKFFNKDAEPGCLIWPISYLDELKTWEISWVGVSLPYGKADVNSQTYNKETMDHGAIINYPIKVMYLGEAGYGNLKNLEGKGFTEKQINEQISIDVFDELRAVVELSNILNCKNIEKEDIKQPEKLNKKRREKKRLPFFDYKVLKVKNNQRVDATSSESARQSPRQHMRRGHIRHLKDKNIWVSSCIVGSSNKGLIIKDYLV